MCYIYNTFIFDFCYIYIDCVFIGLLDSAVLGVLLWKPYNNEAIANGWGRFRENGCGA